METISTLFIGGAADGRRIYIPDDFTQHEISVEDPNGDQGIRIEKYRRVRIYFFNRVYSVFLLENLKEHELIERLLDNYPRITLA